jgi:hypothetical protein
MRPEILDRHLAFWNRSAVDRPLIARLPPRIWQSKPFPVAGGRFLVDPTTIGPNDIDVDRLLGLDSPLPSCRMGDLLSTLGPAYPQAWMEALIGCPISASAFGCVALPATTDACAAAEAFSEGRALASVPGSVEVAFAAGPVAGWLSVMSGVLRRAGEAAQADGQPVEQLHLRGVIDMLAAYLGEERLCQAVYDCPAAVQALAGAFACLYCAVASWDTASRRPWHGGYVSCWGVYAPGPLLDCQIDAASLFSPAMYERLFLPYDRQVLAQYQYAVLHLHACGLRHLDGLLATPEVSALEVSLDRDTGKWDKETILAACRRVQQRNKSLIIYGELNDAELAEFTSALSPRGLAIVAFAHN